MFESELEVLIVEDNPAEAELAQELLSRSRHGSFRSDVAATLTEGVERLLARDYDAVLLDFHLPDGEGPETFARIRTAAPTTPVIILTNLEDEEAALHAMRLGAQDYMIKKELVGPQLLSRSLRYAITRDQAERARRSSEERWALAAQGAHDGLWDWDLEKGVLELSPRWHDLLGLEAGEDSGTGRDLDIWLERVHPDDRSSLESALEAHIRGEAEHFEHEHRIQNRDGRYVWVVQRGLAVRDETGNAYRMAGSMNDITARKRAEAQLAHDAIHDYLTGLPNRALLRDRVDQALRHATREDDHCALLFLDVDRFKNVNDSLGHAAGDELLLQIAGRLQTAVREADTVARLGGDEFAILTHDVEDVSDAGHAAQRILDRMMQPFVISGTEIYTGSSIGISLSASSYHRADDMIRDAEIAMYRAKAGGKNRYEVFDEDMHRRVVALLELETDLRRALSRQEFVMHYQPIVSLESSRLVGFEALVRWQHPERGLVRPAQFIAVAEETGMIVPLAWWVLEAAARQIAAWQKRYPSDPPLTVSCNVSGKLFLQSDVVDRVVEILEKNRLDPGSLRLEITENVLMDHGDAVLPRLGELRALGVQLDIDDFGTGYSSLSYLQRFRYDTLKIDRSFVNTLEQTGDSAAIVKTILALGATLEMNVIAEGVETEDQAQRLRDLRCPQGQGYWFAHPMGVRDVELLMAEKPGWAAES